MAKVSSDSLKDRVILITGAGDGIGRVAALDFAQHGATIILLGRTTQKLEAVYDQIIAAGGPEPGIVPMDLAGISAQDLPPLLDAIGNSYGHLDGLLHNAGILGDRVPFEHYSMTTWHDVMQVNLNAVVMLTHALLPFLKRSADARLVFTSSGVGTRPRAYWGAYAVSKHAIEGFAQLLADELEQTSHIRVNTINPGGTRTAMRAAAFPAEDPNTLKTAEDLMPLYRYLLGPESRDQHGRLFTSEDLADLAD